MCKAYIYKLVQKHLKDVCRTSILTTISLNSASVNTSLMKRHFHSCSSRSKGKSLCTYNRLVYISLHRDKKCHLTQVSSCSELMLLSNSGQTISDTALKKDKYGQLRRTKELFSEKNLLCKTAVKGKQLLSNSYSVFKRGYHGYQNQSKGRELYSHGNVFKRGSHDEATISKSRLPHTPVMLDQVLKILNPQPGQVFLDMTFGAGGHSREVLSVSPSTRVIALDRDPTAYHYALQLQEECSEGQLLPLLGKFSEIGRLLTAQGYKPESIDSVLFDVGVSSMQFDQSERGFMLSKDGPLDMRMDGNRFPDNPSAADVVNIMSESELYHIIKKYGEERMARKIANMIVESRYAFGKIKTTKQLADIISSVFDGEHKTDKMMRHAHVATKTFQAFRIFVNNELNELNNGLELVHKFLKPGGICVVLSFHSLEDRIVKRHFHGIAITEDPNLSAKDHFRNSRFIHERDEVEKILEKRWEPFSKKLMIPRHVDCLENPRARSAKLRAAYKVKMAEPSSVR